jgi:hypothetical protein
MVVNTTPLDPASTNKRATLPRILKHSNAKLSNSYLNGTGNSRKNGSGWRRDVWYVTIISILKIGGLSKDFVCLSRKFRLFNKFGE